MPDYILLPNYPYRKRAYCHVWEKSYGKGRDREISIRERGVINLYHSALQSVVVPGPAASASLRNFLDRQAY